MNATKLTVVLAAAAASSAAFAEMLDRPGGIKIGERLTLRPYVSAAFTYDSNVDSGKHSKSGSSWTVNPGVGLDYKADNWGLQGEAHYSYHAYNNYSSQLNSSSFGERLTYHWANSEPNERGWSAQFSESYEKVSQDDDMSNHDGRGIGRDRQQFSFNGVVERRLNQYLHGAIDAGYYYLDYDNDVDKYAPMYGWKRANLGGELGYALSSWTDFIVAGSYQWYWQDNDKQRRSSYYNGMTRRYNRTIDGDSKGWTISGGIATRATERISYRLLGGWSRFSYGGGVKDLDSFTYSVSGNWKVSDTLSLMMLGSSYYQPSETGYGSARKTYTFSTGLAKSFVRSKVSGSVDISYRKETTEYSEYDADDSDDDIWTGRVGLNYSLNRFFSIYGSIEYQVEDSNRRDYDYDRWRGTVGVRLAY